MINEIHIKNYRQFSSLDIPHLERVNLIVGKNNSGKSSLLEAIYLLMSENPIVALLNFLQLRGEYTSEEEVNMGIRRSQNYHIGSLFYDRDFVENMRSIQISENKRNSLKISPEPRQQKFSDQINDILDDPLHELLPFTLQKHMGSQSSKNTIQLSNEGYLETRRGSLIGPQVSSDSPKFITTTNIDYRYLARLWDKIVLTAKYDVIIEALRILEPRVENIAFTSQQNANSGVLVKLRDSQSRIPIGSMGDGMRRILNIVISLVISNNQSLLIDEIDTGLHYTALTNMWRLVFRVATDLDIQVFATTHSWECIQAFQKGLSEHQETSGQVIRLEYKKDKIVPITYNREDLEIAVKQEIEVR